MSDLQSASAVDHMDQLRDAARRHFVTTWRAEVLQDPVGLNGAFTKAWTDSAAQGWLVIGDADAGLGLRELILLAEETGRASCPLPLAEAFLVHHAARLQHAPPAVINLARLIGDGQVCVAIALIDEHGRGPVAEKTGSDTASLSGSVAHVPATQLASHILLVDESAGTGYLVARDAPGVTIIATPGLAVPALAQLTLESVTAVPVPVPRDSIWILRLAQAARAAGAARRTFELALEWANSRAQFGQVIGRFQAIQHKLANCIIDLDATELMIRRAAEGFDADSEDWSMLASGAVAFASSRLRQVVLEAQHTLAGTGYFEEHEAPRHFRRIHADAVLLGGVDTARAALARLVLERGNLPDIDMGEKANSFRQEVRRWLQDQLGETRHDVGPDADPATYQAFTRALVNQGYTCLGWPIQFGGQARSPAENFAFAEELRYQGAPLGIHSVGENIIGTSLQKFGTPAQLERFVTPIRERRISICLGYSEPQSGSDLASLKTRAVRNEQGWRINGSKLYTTGGQFADYVWLAARTDPDAPAHKGISVFLVPMNTPGITVQPMQALHGGTACAVFYDEVQVGEDALIGPENGGWQVITAALAHERVTMGAAAGNLRAQYETLVHVVSDDPVLRADTLILNRLGQLGAEVEAARLLARRNVQLLEQGKSLLAEAAASKCFTGELMERLAEFAFDIIGPAATLGQGATGALPGGLFEQSLRLAIMFVIGGGTNEIQRNIVATVGLGLPR